MDRLSEAIHQATETAVQQSTAVSGPHYASALEGYGDLARELVAITDDVKSLKKAIAMALGCVNAQDAQALGNILVDLEGRAYGVAYDALRMCAAAKRFGQTVRGLSGGDLLDMLDDMDGDDDA